MNDLNKQALLKAVMESNESKEGAFYEFAQRSVKSIVAILRREGLEINPENIIKYFKAPELLAQKTQSLDPWLSKLSKHDKESLGLFIDQLRPVVDRCINDVISS